VSDRPDYKERLVSWVAPDHLVAPDNISKWHKGGVYHSFPDKRRLRKEGGAAIALGWLPKEPLIGPETRVLAIGSCFARNFTLWLAENGFNRMFAGSPYNALLQFNADFESAAVIAQQFRWAFDELDPKSLLWIDKNRQLVEATEEGKREVRRTLEETDVLILTLGLSEIWYDKASGEPLWRALTEDKFDPERHVFRVETLAGTIEWLEAIERIREAHLPRMKIIFTVSPIPLKTTFRPVSAVTANCVSKSILRAALDEFLRRHETELNTSLYYFPAYEFVTEYFVDPFREDNRHLAPIVPGTIISFFVDQYCRDVPKAAAGGESLAAFPGTKPLERVLRHAAIAAEGEGRELLVRISELEEDIVEKQQICEERQRVIDELKGVADERLRLVEELHRVAAERLQRIEDLESRNRSAAKAGKTE
jgi:hypothetical protein